jgi:hypothetical protein
MVTKKQAHLLKLIYTFRFVTIPLINSYLDTKDHTYLFNTLRKLVDLNLVVRKYNSSYKIKQKAAIYYLSKDGIKLIKKLYSDTNDRVCHLYYNNNYLSYNAINQNLNTMATASAVERKYPNQFNILTKYELYNCRDYLPDDMPKNQQDLFVIDKETSEKYLIFYMVNNTIIDIRKRLQEYIDHYTNSGWCDQNYPNLVFITRSKKIIPCVNKIIDDDLYLCDDRPKIIIARSSSNLNFSDYI